MANQDVPAGGGDGGTGTGDAAAQPVRPAKALAALAATAVILALATMSASAAGTVFDSVFRLNEARSWGAGEQDALTTARLAVFLLVFQAMAILLTILAAALFAKGREQLLPLSLPPGGAFTVVGSVALLLVLAACYSVAIYVFDKRAIANDVLPFVDLLRTRTWWMMLIAAAVGAPLAEELLFRGFLFGVLRRSAAGSAGAGIVTAAVWSSLHAAYSPYGMAAIFLIGLYLAWVRERTGSLVTPMICHGLYNGTVVAVLASAPDTVFKLG